jgi:hypothetical protein
MLWLALACALTVAVAGCLLVADLLGQVLVLWQERPPSVCWLNAGGAGQGVLAAAAICVLVAGARRPGWRRGTVLAEVLIVLVPFGWFFLTAGLQRRAFGVAAAVAARSPSPGNPPPPWCPGRAPGWPGLPFVDRVGRSLTRHRSS